MGQDSELIFALGDEVRRGCAYHAALVAAGGPATTDGIEPPLVQIEDDHLVACAHIDEPGGCPDARTVTAAA